MRQIAALALGIAAVFPQGRATPDQLVSAWYPILHAGNTWVYADEAREADAWGHHGVTNPTVGRWRTTETVSAVDEVPEGIHVTIQTHITDIVRLNGWNDKPSHLTPETIELLVRTHCAYQLTSGSLSYPDDIWTAYDASHQLRPEFRNALLRGEQPALFCFPMAAPGEWGRVASTPPDEEGVWKIKALNGDPFGAQRERTYHIYGHQGSGDTTDYWFQQRVGVVQFVEVHHGTYTEYRRRLLNTTIDGVRTR